MPPDEHTNAVRCTSDAVASALSNLVVAGHDPIMVAYSALYIARNFVIEADGLDVVEEVLRSNPSNAKELAQ